MLKPLVLAALFAGAAQAQETVELDVLHAWPSHSPWQEEIAATYMAANPGVEITFRAPSTDYDEGLVSVIRQSLSGDEPDIFLVGSHLLREVAARDLGAPMTDLLEGRDLGAMGYAPETIALTQINGVQWGLPWTSSTPVMFYNAELVRMAGGDPDAMPTDWTEIIALAARIDAIGDDVMGMYYPIGDDDWMTQNLLATAGLAPITAEGTLAFQTEKGGEAIALFKRFHDDGGQEAISNTAARQQMYAGKLGLYFNSTAAVRSFSAEIGDRFDWRTGPMPGLVADAKVASGGMAAVILTQDPAKRQAAMDYILYGTGAEAQAFVVQNTGYMPVNSGAMSDDLLGAFYAENPNWKTSADQMGRALPWFAWPGRNGVRISQLVLDDMSALANDQMDVDETIEALTTGIEGLIP